MAVWLTLFPSVRVQASDITEITETYPYIYWLPDYQSLIVSKKVLGGYTISDSNGIYLRNLDENVYEETSTTTAYLLTIANYQQGDCYTLVYNAVTGWEARQPMMVRKRTVATVYTAPMVTLYTGERVYTNGQSVPSPYSSAGTTLPNDIPPLDSVSDAINDALNATTNVTTQAVTINKNINNTYNTYQSGGITEAEFNEAMETYRTQLEALSNEAGATLADQMAVNNALTNLDITINQQLNNVDPQLQARLYSKRSQMQTAFNNYKNGSSTQEQTISLLEQYINNVTQELYDYSSTADLNAINLVINFGQSLVNSVGNYSDLDKNLSDSFESSEQAEKEYLNELTSETTASIQDISPKNEFSEQELGAASNIMQIIWDNKFVKSLLVICGCFMVVCVVLGIRYKV